MIETRRAILVDFLAEWMPSNPANEPVFEPAALNI
jgi:hypothetical protein